MMNPNSPDPDCNRRILIVDDNEAIHEDFRKILNGGSESGSNLAELSASLARA